MEKFNYFFMAFHRISYGNLLGARKRMPTIRFRHGNNKQKKPTSPKPQRAKKKPASKYTAASLEPFSYQDIMDGWQDEAISRKPVTEEQIEIINSGGADQIVNKIPEPSKKEKGKKKKK